MTLLNFYYFLLETVVHHKLTLNEPSLHNIGLRITKELKEQDKSILFFKKWQQT